MAKVTGTARGLFGRDGIAEYVRTDTGAVYRRVKVNGRKGKWEFQCHVDQNQVAYRGNTWCTHAFVLEVASKYRLPKENADDRT